MKIVSYNVNGIRSAISKGLLEWLLIEKPDIVCFQEVKAALADIPVLEFQALGYHTYWHTAEKKGYSGVGILSKIAPDSVIVGMGNQKYDREGRVIRADFGDVSIVSVYHPSGSSGDDRQAFKYEWLTDFEVYIDFLKKERPKLVLCGDFNICHRPIDIHNPVSNAKSSGFLPEERAWMEKFINSGFVDTFRHFNQSPHQYSWWSFRSGARAKNLGWRIDYLMATENLKDSLLSADILMNIKHSDHCPVLLELK
jgi:exodeoxyribonuclease-3